MCYMATQPQISQRDLRLCSKEIMDLVERGQSFTVTRDGHQIGELIPLRQRRSFVPREEFLAGFVDATPLDLDRFRADLDAVLDDERRDPYAP
jgi:antitoxin (DNA-binding transcriptional repressor) of toxin-antitoxin stability system